jgi:hypothetical protein
MRARLAAARTESAINMTSPGRPSVAQTRMHSLIPRNCKCRLRYNPARLAVFSGGELYRAQGTCFNLLYLCPGKQALLSFFHYVPARA